MSVVVPDGLVQGDVFAMRMPDGELHRVVVPAGAEAGQEIKVGVVSADTSDSVASPLGNPPSPVSMDEVEYAVRAEQPAIPDETSLPPSISVAKATRSKPGKIGKSRANLSKARLAKAANPPSLSVASMSTSDDADDPAQRAHRGTPRITWRNPVSKGREMFKSIKSAFATPRSEPKTSPPVPKPTSPEEEECLKDSTAMGPEGGFSSPLMVRMSSQQQMMAGERDLGAAFDDSARPDASRAPAAVGTDSGLCAVLSLTVQRCLGTEPRNDPPPSSAADLQA